jgi:hypothetical protein
MKNTQKTFTIKLHTTNTDMDKYTIEEFIKKAIEKSEYAKDLTYTVEDEVGLLFNFLTDNIMAFSFFIRKSKEEFLEDYPYFAEEYDFTLSEFNKNAEDALLTFLENTSTKELTEPYGLLPDDFSWSVGVYIRKHMDTAQQAEFLKKVASRGLKIAL